MFEVMPTQKKVQSHGLGVNGFSRYGEFSLAIIFIPFEELPVKYFNMFGFLVGSSGVSVVTPTESDCRGMVSLTLPQGTL